MAQSSAELQDQLQKQQADYLSRLEAGGQLPTVINNAVAASDNGQTAKLQQQEGDLTKNYIAAGATNREKYKDVWDPFARDRLAANATAQAYQPINDIRKELAMRAQALGVATSAATSMYNADNQKAQTAIGFTQDAYSRALNDEQIAYKKQQDAIALAESRASRASSSAAKVAKEKEVSPDMVNKGIDVLKAVPSDNPNDVTYDAKGNKTSSDQYLSRNEAQTALNQLVGMYGDPTVAAQVFARAIKAGGFSEYNPAIGPKYSFNDLSVG